MMEGRRKRKKWHGYSQRIERNILGVYIRASESDRDEGLHWYRNANLTCQAIAARCNVGLDRAVGVVAALSPGREWGLNLLEAEELIKEWTKGRKGRDLPQVGTYGRRNVIKAERILSGDAPLEVLGGNKVRSFYANILDPLGSSEVTIDRHAKGLAIRSNSLKGATAEEDANVSRAEYPFYARHYVKVADRLGLIPHQLQAICWVTWRRLRGNLAQTDLPF